MKRLLPLLLCSFLLHKTTFAQQTYHFLDDNFAQFILQKYPGCLTFIPPNYDTIPERFDSGYIIKTPVCSAIANEDSLAISNLFNVEHLKGFEAFTSLQYLSISNSSVNTSSNPPLPFPNSVKHLELKNCNSGGGYLTLPVLPDSLIYFDCSGSYIWVSQFSINKLPKTLEYFDCSNNILYTLPDLPPSLLYLNCSGQTDKNLTSSPKILNQLGDLPPGLQYLNCSSNILSSLPDLPETLTYLDCSNMIEHDINYEKFTPTLFCLPKLPQSLRTLVIDTTIKCLPNYGLFGTTGRPLCLPSSGCPMPTNIYGSVFYDLNQNGIKDGDDHYKSNIKINFSGGSSVFTNQYGTYKIPALSGTYTIVPETPPYYTAVPDSINFTFNTNEDLTLSPIALQSNATVDSFKISITPITWATRPGFKSVYNIQYENAGTTTRVPSIILNYDNSILTFISSDNPSITDNGTSLSLTDAPLVPGLSRNLLIDFNVKVNAILGDTIITMATITANSFSATDSSLSVVSGSYDPNDKQSTPQLTPQQVSDGKYINYTIRFQNTGTDTAFNVVITDTLSSLLQAGTLEILNSSHSCNTTLSGNKIAFEFLNILLPDSNVNEPLSHGFVTFKIKPLANVTNGTSISNKASIYFDYNLPIVTNTTSTLIQDAVLSVTTYTFTGNGNWSNPANWSNNIIPPSNLNNRAQIIIDPPGFEECILDVQQIISAGSKLTIKEGKRFRVNGNLLLQ